MQNQIRQQEEVEKQVLEKIKMKMDRIKATHDKQNNKDNHFDGKLWIMITCFMKPYSYENFHHVLKI